jgi:GNAT superfamily N-acetyltransferase
VPKAPAIRLLHDSDIELALTLSATAGWNQRVDDWRMLLQLAPAGSFCATLDDRIVGTAIGIDYGGFAWIAMMLVDPAFRGRGIGGALLEHAMEAVPSDRPIRLDATPMGRRLYQRHGFEDETVLTRHVAPAVRSSRVQASAAVQSMSPEAIPEIAAHDRKVFGSNRETLLRWSLANARQYAWIARGDGPRRYCFGRSGRLFDQIGPVVSDDVEIARTLASAALSGAGDRTVAMDVFDSRRAFTDWLASVGFEPQRPLFRMRRPPRASPVRETVASGDEPVEYAIFGPEFA